MPDDLDDGGGDMWCSKCFTFHFNGCVQQKDDDQVDFRLKVELMDLLPRIERAACTILVTDEDLDTQSTQRDACVTLKNADQDCAGCAVGAQTHILPHAIYAFDLVRLVVRSLEPMLK